MVLFLKLDVFRLVLVWVLKLKIFKLKRKKLIELLYSRL